MVRDCIEVLLREDDSISNDLPESILRYVTRTGESVLLEDALESAEFSRDSYITRNRGRSILFLPMIRHAKLVGVLYLENRLAPGVFTPARYTLLKLLASQAATSLENARLNAKLRKTEDTMKRAQQMERERIARELHDTLLQGTQALVLLFHSVSNRVSSSDPVKQQMREALDHADQLIDEARRRVMDLREPDVATGPLPDALTATGSGLSLGGTVACHTSVVGTVRELSETINGEGYRIGREAVLNAFRHAQASTINIQICYEDDALRLLVRDDGVGIATNAIEAATRSGHWGLKGMLERAQQINARLEILSRPGLGTEIELIVPATIAYK
jgi:signal transduction histidine kinase